MNWVDFFVDAAMVIGIPLTVIGIYFLIVALFSLKKEVRYKASAPEKKFAVVIAARNEAAVIGKLVDSLRSQKYPKELYKIFVVPNNCTDNTEEVARRHGAEIVHCTVPVKTKGEVLHHALPKIMNGFDSICVFDADNIVDENFLAEMNNAFCAGAKCAQGYRDSKNPYTNWLSGSYTLYYKMINFIQNRARSNAKLSALINGTGFAVSCDLINQIGGWNTKTLVEDLEFSVNCILAGEKVHWVPAALTYDEHPVKFGQSVTQRKRWTSGTLHVSALYIPKFFKAFRKQKKFAFLDALLVLCLPYVQLLSMFLAVVTALPFIIEGFTKPVGYQKVLEFIGIPLALSYVGLSLGCVILSFIKPKMTMGITKGVLSFWIFMATWIPIQILCAIKRTTTWKQIDHTGNVSSRSVNKQQYKATQQSQEQRRSRKIASVRVD